LKEKYAKALNVPASSITPMAKNSESENDLKEPGNAKKVVNKDDTKENKENKEEKTDEKDNKDNKKEKGNAEDKDIQVQYISLDSTNPPKEVLISRNEQNLSEILDSKEENGQADTAPIKKDNTNMDSDGVIDKSDPKYAEEKYLLAGEKEEKPYL
jgi:hypothetical protein